MQQFNILVALATQKAVTEWTLLESHGLKPLPISTVPLLPLELQQLEITLAVKIARDKIKDDEQQAKMLCALAEVQPDLQEEALERVLLYGRQGQVGGMEYLTGYLKLEIHDRMIDVLNEFTVEFDQIDIIRGLAPLLSPQRLTRLLEQTELTPNRNTRSEAMGLLIRFLPEPQRTAWAKKAHQRASLIDDKQIREAVISTLIQQKANVPLLLSEETPSVESNATRLALRRITTNLKKHVFRCDWIFVKNLRHLFPLLTEEQMKESFDIWAKEANGWTNPFVAYFIGNMASYTPSNFLPRVFDFTLASFQQEYKNDTDYTYLCTLADLAKSLPPSLLSHVVDSLQSIQSTTRRHCVHIALAPFFHALATIRGSKLPAYDVAIKIAREISDTRLRRWAFLSLLPHLPSEYIDEAINEIWEIVLEKYYSPPGYLKQYALVRIAPFLPMERFEQVIDILDNEFDMQYVRNIVLNIIANRIISLDKNNKHKYWNEILRRLANRGRPDFLRYLTVFVPVIEPSENQEVLKSMVRDILEISTWWP